MKLNDNLPERFTRAIEKLYTAFHNGTLDAMDCSHCAVGNLCDNKSDWRYIEHYGLANTLTHRRPFEVIQDTNYSVEEIINIEKCFMYGAKLGEPHRFENVISNSTVYRRERTKEEQKELQFKGLCAVVEYLCELDGIPNVMDFSKLFETEDNVAKYELIK